MEKEGEDGGILPGNEIPQEAPEDSSSGEVEETEGNLLFRKVKHLPTGMMQSLMPIITESCITAQSLHDLRQADVLVKHDFELTDNTTISHRLRWLPQKHNEIVRIELTKMLDAGIVTPYLSG